MDVLVVDVGGTHVKISATGQKATRRFTSGPDLTPDQLVGSVLALVNGWNYKAVSIGYPGRVFANAAAAEPGNLSNGWVGFDFAAAFGCPVRIVNDAVLQALGVYDGGRMLFLGLGTGLGSALVSEHVVISLELGNLTWRDDRTLGDTVGRKGLEALGIELWRQTVHDMVRSLHAAFAVDYVVLGGGNAEHIKVLPPHTRSGGRDDAFVGGVRLWEELVEPHDREPALVWRVVA